MIKAECLEQIILSGAKTYPIFVGFLSASDILKVSKVPSFAIGTHNESIANNVLTPPVKEWQRPLDEARKDRIATVFNNSGEFMPNPVLLSENVLDNRSDIRITPKVVSGSVLTDSFIVEIDEPQDSQEKPLWVIDGQHRINGLARSQQATNLIPVVFLLNKGLNLYDGPTLAKIFAQVTTAAEKLDDIHNEWLTYSFSLNKYATNQSLRDGMKTTALLCSKPNNGGNVSNPFYSNIIFNKTQSASPAPGGFHYNCIELSEIISKYYYSKSAPVGSHLSPDELYKQIVVAHEALRMVVTNTNQSAFFGHNISGKEFWHKSLTDAFFIGIFSYLLSHTPPTSINDYRVLFNSLHFNTSDWNFNQWIVSLSGGSNQSNSRSIVFGFFESIFRTASLPGGINNIDDFLKGNMAELTFSYCTMKSNGKPDKTSEQITRYLRGGVHTETIGPRTYVKIASKTMNIGKIEVFDKQSPSYSPRTFDFQRGVNLSTVAPQANNPLDLKIHLSHYGGVQSVIDLTLKW